MTKIVKMPATGTLFQKIFKVTKLTAILMTVAILNLNATGSAQHISLNAKNANLKSVFQAIKKQTGYVVFYNSRLLTDIHPVTIDSRGMPLDQFLDRLLSDQPLGYELRHDLKTIILSRKQLQQKHSDIKTVTTANEQFYRKISGKVFDKEGKPVSGVSVTLKSNSNIGVVTDEQGAFTINAETGDLLILTSIGYKTKSVEIKDQSHIEVLLEADIRDMDEFVVVGYGMQKKVNLTGSVATINSSSLANRPVTNVSSALAGLGAGITVQQGSGRPGFDGSAIRIRGIGTLNNSDALVIIDGIQGSLDAVNPNDIESISILKDAASASIYGSLAANGVILVTTKKGNKNKLTLSYSGILSQTRPAAIPRQVSDYVRHMNLVNEGYRNIGQANAYSQATIDAWTAANANPSGTNDKGVPNYIAYPNTDWGEEIFKNSLMQNHNLTLNGGNDKINVLLSGGYLSNQGVLKNTGSQRFQFRANIQAKLMNFLTMGTQTFVSSLNRGVGAPNTFQLFNEAVPGQYPLLDGKFGYPQAPEETLSNNPLLTLYSRDGMDKETRFNSTLFANAAISKHLSFETKVNYQTFIAENNLHVVPLERWDFATNELKLPATTPNNLTTTYGMARNYQLTFDNVLRYAATIAAKHDIAALAGYNQNYFNYYSFSATGMGLIDESISILDSANAPTSIGGSEYDRAIRSWFGRVNYAFDRRYLFEAVVRYDGSSRFSQQSRWGLFPAFSAGWRLSQEKFLQQVAFIDDLKLRASYGKTGNNASGDYDYQSLYSSQIYSFNRLPVTGLAQTKIPNPDLKWEETVLTNIGLDGSFFNGGLSFEFEVYRKVTDGILFVPTIPLTTGTAQAPTRNIAAVVNRGFEVVLGHRGNSGPFKWSVSGNFAYNHNEVNKYKGSLVEGYVADASGKNTWMSNLGDVSNGTDQRILEGHVINEYFLYPLYKGNGAYFNADGSVNINGGPKDGMIRTEADLAWVKKMIEAGYQFLPGNTVGKAQIYYGDFIYADRNSDGVYGNTFDRYFTGVSQMPKYNFGLQATFNYRNFDFSMIWSGNAGMSYFWNQRGFSNSIVGLGDGISKLVADDHYYYNDANPEDPANNLSGRFPRLKAAADQQNNIASDFYLYNASYIKLRNMQLGYNFSQKILRKTKLSQARLFFTGENLITITSYPGLDPEIGAEINYPTLRQFSIGLNVSF